MSVLGIQHLSGANVDEHSQAAPHSWGSSGQQPVGKATTDAQLEALRGARSRASSSLQAAARNTADEMAAAKVCIKHVASDTARFLASAGESAPRELAAIVRPTTQVIANIVGFSSVIGSWIVSGSSQLVSGTLGAVDSASGASIGAAEAALNGVQTLMSAAQTQFVLGVEGAAILENMFNIHEAEFREIYNDIGYMQLARGISAYACLQQLARPSYIHAGVCDACGPGMEGDTREVKRDRKTIALWLRYMRLSACAYGVQFMTVTGVCDPHLLVMGNAAALYERTGITQDKVIHAVWENEGYAAPAWLLVQDDSTHAVCLVISGSKNNSDWLSNLRCANVHIKQGDHFGDGIALSEEELREGVSVHAGIWAAAVKMDERCLEIVSRAMLDRPDWQLVLMGHSLGAGTATLLGMRWRSRGLFPGFKVYAYGVPPTVSSRTIGADAQDYITSFQCSDDFVTRWCLGTSRDIFKAGHALASVEGVADALVNASLHGYHTDAAGTSAQHLFAADATQDYASYIKERNRVMFQKLLLAQQDKGLLPAYAVDPLHPYLKSVTKAEVVTDQWLRDTLLACEERMDSDKLLPLGKCHWLVPILQVCIECVRMCSLRECVSLPSSCLSAKDRPHPAGLHSQYSMCSPRACVLFENVFSQQMCSLRKCVVLENVSSSPLGQDKATFRHQRMCSLTTECVLLLQNVFS